MRMTKCAIAACVATTMFAGPVLAQDVAWELVNDSGATLVEFYTSPTATDDWQNDLLDGGSLASGESGDVTIADGESVCDYDLRFVFDDWSTLEDTVNICDMGSYTINP